MSRDIGIDLGTTNSCVSVIENGEPVIVAAKNGYTTRIPFVASQEIKQKAKEVFF